MTGTRKYCTPEFTFSKVMLQPHYVIYVIALVAAAVAAMLFTEVIQRLFSRGGLPLTFILMGLFMMLILRAAERKVVIYFDEKSMFISTGGKRFKRYLKSDIAGICSHPYDERDRSRVSLTIVLRRDGSIHLTDTRLIESQDKAQAAMLRHFLSAAKTRLQLNYIRKDRWRAIQGIGAHWYA